MSSSHELDYCTCKHKEIIRSELYLKQFEIVFSFLYKFSRLRKKNEKKLLCACHNCGLVSGRLHACIGCATFSCWSKGHALDHYKNSNHIFAADFHCKQIYCFLCEEYIYDSVLDRFKEIQSNKARLSALQSYDYNPRRILFTSWKPSEKENQILRRFSTRNGGEGLRGLNNLGNTCFMSCILQSFIHNPLLRNFFLSGKHTEELCVLRSAKKKSVCLACELNFLFREFFSGSIHPYSPHKFLHSVWTHAHHLSGYEQQDAHEFFIAALYGMHLSCQGKPKKCQCIIHQIFTGALRSDVSCMRCGHVSTTVDPFWDVSLDLHGYSSETPGSTTNKKSHTLYDCLRRFTQPESLGSDQKIFCSNCNSKEEKTKQLSIKHSPIVLCFHLKRFEHYAQSSKLRSCIEFTSHLSIAPFLSSAIVRKRECKKGKNVSELEKEEEISLLESMKSQYTLFSVVNHHGSLHSGHYVSYVKHNNQWFLCDDGAVTTATLEQVLNSEGYLLFYIKDNLEFERSSI
ncbi:ubiquitin carboxyl-terminal hydrolase 22-like isoform X2 [Zophobas morio]|uniref:ubiquitin carboxyl-terminal hydrolase 22-like isoform X2 n=1 Tax=Zophobas morio TaxID=2755281 RepID=UPI00308355DA